MTHFIACSLAARREGGVRIPLSVPDGMNLGDGMKLWNFLNVLVCGGPSLT